MRTTSSRQSFWLSLAKKSLSLAVPAAFVLPGAMLGACGKDPNVHEPVLVEFPHSFPEAPRELSRSQAPAWTTGHPLAATEQHLFLVDRDNRELVRLDRKTLARQKAVSLGGKPEQLVVAPDGGILVTMRSTGEVLRVSQDLVIEQRVKLTTTEAYGIALSVDGDTAFVTLPQAHELVSLDVAELAILGRTQVLDTPRGVTVSPNGWAMVVHQFAPALQVTLSPETGLPVDQTATGLRAGNPVDHLMGNRLGTLHQARALAGTVNPETGAAYVAHVLAAPGTESDFLNTAMGSVKDDGTSSGGGDGYGSSTPGATFQVPTRPVEVTVTSTDMNGEVAPAEMDFPVQDTLSGEPMTHLVDQPVDIAHHPSWSLLFMVGYGSDNVLVSSTAEGDPMRSPVAVIDVGHAPRGIAFSPDGKTAYVLNEHELTVSVVDLTPLMSMQVMADGSSVMGTSSGSADGSATTPVPMAGARDAAFDSESQMGANSFATSDPTPGSAKVSPIRLKAQSAKAYGTDPMPAEIRRGARTFTFARNGNLSHAGEFACGTCHFEGTEDKLVWFISDGPRQTPSLAGRLLGTAPFNWAGSKDALSENMTQTVERMRGKGLTNQELGDLEQFLLYGLEAPKNPNLEVDAATKAKQELGKQIFESKEAGCAGCHQPSRNFTDGFSHDVGTASQAELTTFAFTKEINPDAREPWRLDTPTLKGLFYTAPYLHDGSAKTLLEVLDRTSESMGKTSHLSQVEKEALVEYLKTL